MPTFIITTRSVFENKYAVDAATLDDAVQCVMNEKDVPDFLQKHLGEAVVDSDIADTTKYEMYKRLNKVGYY